MTVLQRPPRARMKRPARALSPRREVYPSILDTIGETPLVQLSKLFPEFPQALYGKLECFNPGGSIKDRTALNILNRAVESGALQPGATVIESSSGNMAIGLALVCRYWGLRLIVVVDPKINLQTLKLLGAYGAKIHQVSEPAPGSSFLEARLAKVKELLTETPGSFWTDQYHNADNPGTHQVTMREILRQMQGKVDYVFAATSTCGTLMGCVDYLSERQSKTKVIAVDARGSVIFGAAQGARLIPGHGAGRESDFLVRSRIDRVVWPLLRMDMLFAYYAVVFKDHRCTLHVESNSEQISDAIDQFHSDFPEVDRFDPNELFQSFDVGESAHESNLDCLRDAVASAEVGELNSPLIAAAAVWRYATPLFSKIYRFGGLTPTSQRSFLKNYAGHFNRLAFGPPVVNMRKMIAVAEAGLLDFSFARNPTIRPDEASGLWTLQQAEHSQMTQSCEALIDARVPKKKYTRTHRRSTGASLKPGKFAPTPMPDSNPAVWTSIRLETLSERPAVPMSGSRFTAPRPRG